MPSAKKKDAVDFEQSLIELEKIVERMERGEQSLDETISDFERGMTLSDQCQKNLDSAQMKVEKLIKKHEKYQLESHESEVDND
ncbi:MAG: exodeoxyribonuclease VII small subunit [Gammaproteobacteria bacterium]|nr:exodeoxyribonuclease VII small subunit [Gammaproteobacteria bacterium]